MGRMKGLRMITTILRPTAVLLATLTLGGAVATATFAADEPSTTAPAPAAPAPAKPIDVRKLFATNCSWCHQDYGMKAADGPKLAGTRLTHEQVIERIQRGKSPMPGFRKLLNQEQIEALATYIKGLKDPDAQ